MFQRIKGAIDSRIAEEQARAKAASSGTRSSSTHRRSTSTRNESPSRKPLVRTKVPDDGGRGPDPSEFEKAFVIGDESEEVSRTGTPAPPDGNSKETVTSNAGTATAASTTDGNDPSNVKAAEGEGKPPASTELPPDVKAKLRKLDKLESRYQELLRSYRVAHARAISIEPFEKTLKENTPLTSISEPGALVEYLNQLNLRSDMVMDELKRVTADRDEFKKKFEAAEKQATTVQEELANLKSPQITPEEQHVTIDASPRTSKEHDSTSEEPKIHSNVKSPVSSVLGIFSPKHKHHISDIDKDMGENFFSYEEEIPELQKQLKAKTDKIDELETEIKSLKEDLTSAKSSNESLTKSLQSIEKQLTAAKELESKNKEEIVQIQEKLKTTTKTLEEFEAKASKVEAELKEANDALTAKGATVQDAEARSLKLEEEITELKKLREDDKTRVKTLESDLHTFTENLKNKTGPFAHLQEEEMKAKEPPTNLPTEAALSAISSSKKKNKKKKKGGNGAKDASASKSESVEESTEAPTADSNASDELVAEIVRLKEEVSARNAQIERLQAKKKTEDDLREEIETMQENLLNVGQEHVEAKDKIKELQAEKQALQEKVDVLEQSMTGHIENQTKSAQKEEEFQKMAAEYEELKIKTSTLQSDLGAAQQLATSRYKDLTDLRDVLQKAQPELKTLRSENASLKTAKEELTARTAELRRLEGREKDLKADIASFKKQAADRDNEIKNLSEKIAQETTARQKADEQSRIAGRDQRKAEADKIEIAVASEKTARELNKVQEEAGKLQTKVKELESQVVKLTTEGQGLREDVQLKTTQYATAQGLVGSMRDQTAEMAMQLKEAKDQAESLEEELVEVQRLLSERTREGETMRRLLSDVDDRADAKVREMRERMEAAIEERDRAEDEAATNGRRRAREADDLKSKIRDLERDLKRASDDKEDLERSEREWKRQREEIEQNSERAKQEATDTRAAMAELRNALDETERQAREAEKQRTDLRKLLDEANQKYEMLQKTLKTKQQRLDELSAHSSRTSLDINSRVSSPSMPTNGTANGMADAAYLKTILLQFLEQKDKKMQQQLVPVLGKLLHFDKKDEQKWISAINAK